MITGNVVRSSAQNDENVKPLNPKYRHTVYISDGENGPRQLHFHNNAFQPGNDGVFSRDLETVNKEQ